MSRSVKASTTSTKTAMEKTNVHFLKNRIDELEAEVSSLKKRLDDLRRAKSTTVHKKQKEYISATATERPSSDPKVSDPKVNDLQQRMEDLSLQHSKEMEALKRKYEESLRTSEKSPSLVPPCGHDQEIADLKKRNAALEAESEELRLFSEELKAENAEMREKFEELFAELSIKEAQWCEKEEQLNLKMKLQWGEKYREWMEVTEKKIADLQAANNLLRSYVKPADGS